MQTPDFRDYLDLEDALYRKLSAAWRPQAVALYERINSLIERHEFEQARELVNQIDFTQVGEDNRVAIKYILQSCIYYGGAMASGNAYDRTFVSASAHDALLDKVTDNFILTLSYNVTQQTQQEALQLIAQAEKDYLSATKFDQPNQRYVKDFVSFQKTGDDMLKLVSSLHSSRLSTWGFVAEANVLGIEEYQLTAVLDGRTSEFCRAINGKRFKVQDAKELVNKVLNVENPDDAKVIQPWPKQDKESITMYRDSTPEELTAMGLQIPPFHPHCRTLLTRIDNSPSLEAPAVPDSERTFPQFSSQQLDFMHLGGATPDNIQHWNAYMPVSPMSAAAAMVGATGADLMSYRGHVVSFDKNGDITFRYHHIPPDASVYSTYDPYASAMYSLAFDIKDANPTDAQAYILKVLNGMVDVGTSVGATSVNAAVQGTAVRSYTDMGYTITDGAWFDLKNDILDQMAQGNLPLDGLDDVEQSVVMDVLSTRDADGLKALLDLPFTINGEQVGQYLLDGETMNMFLPLNDPDAVATFREATQ
jgi:hypothetical protein